GLLTVLYTRSLHDALPIFRDRRRVVARRVRRARLHGDVPARRDAGWAEGVQGDDCAHARILLPFEGDARGPEGGPREPDVVRVEQLPEGVVGRVQPGRDAAVLLGGMARAAVAAWNRLAGVLGRGEREVE